MSTEENFWQVPKPQVSDKDNRLLFCTFTFDISIKSQVFPLYILAFPIYSFDHTQNTKNKDVIKGEIYNYKKREGQKVTIKSKK